MTDEEYYSQTTDSSSKPLKEAAHNILTDFHTELHTCHKETEITRLEEKVKTLFVEHDKLNDTLSAINKTQMELLTQITNLNSIISTLKWTLTVMIAVFGGLFLFVLTEVIKMIH